MYSGGQWSGNGQPEMAESLRELVEVMPALPIGEIAKLAKQGLKYTRHLMTDKQHQGDRPSTSAIPKHHEI